MVNLKDKLKNLEVSIGSWITIGSSSIAEVMSRAGFEWLTVDMEHSVITLDKAQELIRAIEACDVLPLVRVGENNANLIKRVMDAGAHGVIVPMVNTREDALRAVAAVKYPPLGSRGVGLARAQGYGFEFEKYKDWVNEKSLVIVQVEHIKAVDNLDKILNVEGVDAFIVGPYDLSGSMGKPGDFECREVKSALKNIIKISKKMKKPAGFHVIQPQAGPLLNKIEEGYKLLSFSFDALFLGQICRDRMREIKKGSR